ncbi:MAG: transcription termination/antitermination NusG family protein [Thermodesulfovibrionales bacterium]
MNWYAIYTKPKCEDSTALQLRNAGIETLNPKIRTKKYIRGKYISVIEPLFPSYIFACFDSEKQGHMIKYTRGVKFVVGKQNPLAVPQEIIEAIQERMQGDIVTPALEKIEKGDRVIIKEGPFVNFYGIFERDIPGRERAMILLEALHSKVEIEILSLRKA